MEKLPTKQQAIQEQIDLIMDEFDFKACIRLLDRLKEDDRAYPKDWYDEEFGWFESAIRKTARQALREAANYAKINDVAMAQRSYFFAMASMKQSDDGPPWVRLYLSFGLHECNDGTEFSDE